MFRGFAVWAIVGLTLCAAVAHGQYETPTTKMFSFGLRGAAVFSRFEFNDSSTFGNKSDYRPGFMAGAFVQVNLGSYFSLRPEFQFIQKGSQEDLALVGSTGSVTVHDRVNYLSFPLMFQFTAPFHSYITLGPRLDFKLSATSDDSTHESELDKLKSSLVGGTVGVGHNFRIGRSHSFLLEGDVLLDATKAFDESGSTSSTKISFKNRAFIISGGFMF